MAALFGYDLQLDAICDESLTFTWYQDGAIYVDGVVTGTPTDLTGAAARLMIRNLPTDATPLVSISTTSTSSGGIVLGGPAGTVEITITKAALSALEAGDQANYDLLIDWSNGTTTKLLSGAAYVGATYTH